MTDLGSLLPGELAGLMESIGEPAYRGEQIFGWLHKRMVDDISQMSNLPKSLRDKLATNFYVADAKIVKSVKSRDGTRKFLSMLHDKCMIEHVLMRHRHGRSVCISSQVGCAMGCTFCQSGKGGLARNLTAGEMCAQVYSAMKTGGAKPAGVVIMGSGEPLCNYDQTLRFIRLITDPLGLDLAARAITLSTCGITPAIHALADEKLQINLAISLNAPSEDIRRQIMPISTKHPMAEVLAMAKQYAEKTGRRVTFEYVLIPGVNDAPSHAQALARALRGIHCHVNLIAFNTSKRSAPTSNADAFIQAFGQGIPITLRRSLGADVLGACGQLVARG